MITQRTPLGQEIEAALGEVLARVRGEIALPCRIVDDPTAERIRALRDGMKLSRQKFAERFGLDAGPYRIGSRAAGFQTAPRACC